MSRLFLVCTFLFGMMLASSGVVTAQETATDVDIAAIGESVLAADPELMVTGLESPPDDASIPEGFINPPSGVAANAEIVDPLTGTFENFEGAIGNVSHGFDTDPTVVPGLISSGILTYIVTDGPIDENALNQIEEQLGQGLNAATPAAEATSEGATPSASGPTTEGQVERVEVGGADAIVTSVSAELGAVNGTIQIVAVPVGNTLVIGTVVVADQGEVDPEQVLGFAEALTLAGVEHIGTVAEGAQ